MKEFVSARKAGVPIIAIETSDPAATVKTCLKEEKALRKKLNEDIGPFAVWCIVRGLVGINEEGESMVQDIAPDGPIQTGNPTECLSLLAKLEKKYDKAVVFFSNADKFIENEGVLQGVWNLRDSFKSIRCSLVLLCPAIMLPPALKQDVIVISEPLPDAEELTDIATSVVTDAGIGVDAVNGSMAQVVDTMRGLSAFAAEQVLAMSLNKQGVDLQQLMKLKRSYISQLPGVEVREDKIAFVDIAGYDNIKTALTRKINGKRPPRLTIWLDEIEKAMAGVETETSGTSGDQLGVLLQWMQDRLNEDRLSAMLMVGFPGVSKSLFAMATKNAAQTECLRIDLGGMKDKFVGNSEQKIRNALKVIDAMSGGHILVLATCNSVRGLPPALMSRFAFGTWFFDLPSPEEGEAIWKLKRKKYGISDDQKNPTSDPWSGREIQQCCFLSDDLQIPLSEAAKYITPFCNTNASDIEAMRKQANKRWLSASNSGFYQLPQASQASRRVSV